MRNFFVLAFFLIALHPTLGQKEVSVKTIDQIKRSIVPIVCGYLDDAKAFQVAQIAGTGFLIDQNGRFITDAHVLDNWDRIRATRHDCSAAIYIPDHGWSHFEPHVAFHYFPFVECQTDSTVDLAVCQPIQNPFRSVVKENITVVYFDNQVWPEGTAIAFVGFPLESTAPINSKGFIGGFQIVGENNSGFDYIVDKAAWPGASGSPVYLGNGKVIGIIRERGQNEASGLAWARSASVIVDFLSKHPASEDQNQQKNP